MRAGWFACLCLCACNRILGLAATREIDARPPADAQYFDAPTDAPFACPATPALPAFSKVLRQINDQDCQQYTISATTGIALAWCYAPNYANMAGPVDGELSPLSLTSRYGPAIYSPLITPEGDRFYAQGYNSTTFAYELASFLAVGDGSWTDGVVQTLPFTFASGDSLGTPSRAPSRHALYVHNTDQTWHDLVETAPDTWSDAHSYAAADLGISYMYEPQLSSDALRLVALGEIAGENAYEVLYTSRASPDDVFPPMQKLPGVPTGATYPFLNEDCSRVYFAGLSSTLYVQQQ